MRMAELNHRIVIQQLITTTSENGFEVQTWSDYKTIWASANNLIGKEYFSAMAVQAEKTVRFTIRYTEGIDETMRIVFQDKIYNITFINNVKYNNNYIEINAIEVI